jgi:hypothetical protein
MLHSPRINGLGPATLLVFVGIVLIGNSRSDASCGDYLMYARHTDSEPSVDRLGKHAFGLFSESLLTSSQELPCDRPGCRQQPFRGSDNIAAYDTDHGSRLSSGLVACDWIAEFLQPSCDACDRDGVHSFALTAEVFRPPRVFA